MVLTVVVIYVHHAVRKAYVGFQVVVLRVSMYFTGAVGHIHSLSSIRIGPHPPPRPLCEPLPRLSLHQNGWVPDCLQRGAGEPFVHAVPGFAIATDMTTAALFVFVPPNTTILKVCCTTYGNCSRIS